VGHYGSILDTRKRGRDAIAVMKSARRFRSGYGLMRGRGKEFAEHTAIAETLKAHRLLIYYI
jgi:hypothetical protein